MELPRKRLLGNADVPERGKAGSSEDDQGYPSADPQGEAQVSEAGGGTKVYLQDGDRQEGRSPHPPPDQPVFECGNSIGSDFAGVLAAWPH